jgi:hypothetical protein
LVEGRDENTKYFHHFANNRKCHNTIWSIDKSDGTKATSFEDIAKKALHTLNLYSKQTPGLTLTPSSKWLVSSPVHLPRKPIRNLWKKSLRKS